MLEKVQMFRTADGSMFECERKALNHVASQCQETLAAMLEPLVTSGKFTHNDVYRVVCTLAGDAETAKRLSDALRGNFT